MRLKGSHKRFCLALLKNKYFLITLLFLVWMTFLDANSWRTQAALNAVISRLKAQKRYYRKETEADRAALKRLEDPEFMERFAREHYHMKKAGERVFIVRRR